MKVAVQTKSGKGKERKNKQEKKAPKKIEMVQHDTVERRKTTTAEEKRNLQS